MAANHTITHYALDLETPPVIACDSKDKAAVHTTNAQLVTCPDCLSQEEFPRLQAHPILGKARREREERALIRQRENERPIVTPYAVLMNGADLLSDEGENPEYDRAIVELTGNLLGAGPDDRLLMARILRALKQAGE